MFGTLRPSRCGLGRDERRQHRALYCGLCQALGQHHGQVHRAMVSFDAVLLAVIADGLSEAPAGPSRTRCPLVPVTHRASVDPDSDAMRFAAHLSVLLADQLVADRAQESALAGFVRPLVAGPATAARAALSELGVDLSALAGFEARQSAAEREPAVTPDTAAAPTAEALALVFGSVAALPSVPRCARPALERLGHAVGRVIYHVDALEDLARDLRRGAFNPCLDPASRRLDPKRREACAHALRGALDEAGRALDELPWRRHRAIAADVVAVEQRRRAEAAAARAEIVRAEPLPSRRLPDLLLAAWVWWLLVGVAYAKEGKGKHGKHPAPPSPAPPEPPEPPQSPCDSWDAFVQWCTDTIHSLQGACSACTDCQDACQGCADGCSQGCSNCGQCCQGCGDDGGKCCTDCGKGCQDAGDCCNNCDQCCQNCQ